MKFYITFGQSHRHRIGETIFDKDSVAEIEAENENEARELAFAAFDARFSASHAKQPDMEHYPRGIVPLELNPEDKRKVLVIIPGTDVMHTCMFSLLDPETGRCFDQQELSHAGWAMPTLWLHNPDTQEAARQLYGEVVVKYINETSYNEDEVIQKNKDLSPVEGTEEIVSTVSNVEDPDENPEWNRLQLRPGGAYLTLVIAFGFDNPEFCEELVKAPNKERPEMIREHMRTHINDLLDNVEISDVVAGTLAADMDFSKFDNDPRNLGAGLMEYALEQIVGARLQNAIGVVVKKG